MSNSTQTHPIRNFFGAYPQQTTVVSTKDRSLPGKRRRKQRKLARRTVALLQDRIVEVVTFSESDLKGHTRENLYAIAKSFGMKGYTRLKADELRHQLYAHPANRQLVLQ